MKTSNSLTSIMAASALLAGATACQSDSGANQQPIIGQPDIDVSNGCYTDSVLEAFGRVTSPVANPDGSKVLFSVAWESVEQNKSNTELWVMNPDGSDTKRITNTAKSEQNAHWFDGGNKIAFIYPDENGHGQLWTMNADGSNRLCIYECENGISGFRISPDEKHIVMIANVKYARTAQDVYPDLPKATGRIIDDLMYKHWDEWVTEIPHPFIGEFNGKTVTSVEDIMADEPYESPMKPFGGIESIAWAPDGKSLVYVSRKKTGMEYAVSTNSDLYLYSLADKSTRNLTEGMMGYDTNPVFSPDGSKLAWLSMEHDGYESDKNRIFVMNMTSGEKTDLTADWDYTVDEIAWAPDGASLFFLAYRNGVKPVFNVSLDRTIKVIAEGLCDYQSLSPLPDGSVITMAHSLLSPNEVYKVTNTDTAPIALTNVNTELLAKIKMPTVEKVMVPTTDGKEMLTWVLLPPNFDANKQYPAILYCQGGPQSAVSQFWSFRWNLALMAAKGYIVIAPNRRGLPGFGTEWNAQISGDYGGQNMRDYLSAVDYVKQRSYVDAAHIGAVGASYGGFSVYWLAGNHDNRFACLVAHAGIFNTEAQYLETEEMWFANWDLGGPFWDKSNPIAQRSFANSPHKFVDKWTAPILITHGEYDFRILASQGMMAFNAARLRGVPAEMLIFPDENHWILKPQNAILWQRVFFRWLDRWLKPSPEQ
ncbi:MAG: S9 family peptidase [Muribaculum sp.]|nr:S9 family peptidase [Muribaculaceae bacterium]MCM1080623.1 S9 family peptidase [Muribaculum sp.]